MPFEMLEPYDGKLSRTVLRRAWGRKTLGPIRCTHTTRNTMELNLKETEICRARKSIVNYDNFIRHSNLLTLLLVGVLAFFSFAAYHSFSGYLFLNTAIDSLPHVAASESSSDFTKLLTRVDVLIAFNQAKSTCLTTGIAYLFVLMMIIVVLLMVRNRTSLEPINIKAYRLLLAETGH